MIRSFSDRKSRRQSRYIAFLVVLSLILCLVSCSRHPVYPEAFVKGSDVVIDVNKLRSENPIFITFRYHGKNINFFVLKIGDKVLSFIDACISCYPSKRGYRVKGEHIACRACDVRYSLSNIETGFGSCSPIRIEGHLRDGQYLIPVSRLEGVVDKF